MLALARFGAPLQGISAETFTDPEVFYQIGVAPTRIDIIMGVDGLNFVDCWPRRETATWDRIKANFISIHDLMINKEKAGRPQDLIDLENLKTALKVNKKLKALD